MSAVPTCPRLADTRHLGTTLGCPRVCVIRYFGAAEGNIEITLKTGWQIFSCHTTDELLIRGAVVGRSRQGYDVTVDR